MRCSRAWIDNARADQPSLDEPENGGRNLLALKRPHLEGSSSARASVESRRVTPADLDDREVAVRGQSPPPLEHVENRTVVGGNGRAALGDEDARELELFVVVSAGRRAAKRRTNCKRNCYFTHRVILVG